MIIDLPNYTVVFYFAFEVSAVFDHEIAQRVSDPWIEGQSLVIDILQKKFESYENSRKIQINYRNVVYFTVSPESKLTLKSGDVGLHGITAVSPIIFRSDENVFASTNRLVFAGTRIFVC